MRIEMLSGNEAVARGVYEAGCHLAAAYPGTPSTEILETLAKNYSRSVYCQWACNEKTAVEIAGGASLGGARAFAAMKHVGMNVAADPIFTLAYSGVNGGFVFVSADDPGCHSSQNEQDNRLFAPHAKIAMLEPSDSAECKEYAKAAFELSEKFDTLVMLRMTTRVCHSKSAVELGSRADIPVKQYIRDPQKNAMLPAHALPRHAYREEMLKKLEEYSNACPFNRAESNGSGIGIITSGIAYQHAKEVFGSNADYLKLGLTFPLPRRLISQFAAAHETLYVIEENEPYLENAVHALGFTGAIGKAKLPVCGELNARIIRDAFLPDTAPQGYAQESVPPRAPTLCAGCPHRGFFYALKKYLNRSIVPIGDIGCYTLGISAPLEALDATICMGAGISSLIGLAKALELQGDSRKPLGCVGDSTFFHSGMTSLMDVAAADANVIACVLDNSITAMTGHQENPGTAKNLMGQPSPALDIERLVLATGIPQEHIAVVDPLNIAAVQDALDAALAAKGPFVIITKRRCALLKDVQKATAGKFNVVDNDKCCGCKMCMRIACPAMAFENGKAKIFDTASCNCCDLCASMCNFGAIRRGSK